VRVAPPEFVAEMQRMFGAMYRVEWREHLGRWVVIGPTADGREVEQTWGWFWREVVSPDGTASRVRVEPGPDGLPPYRGLDRDAQLEILSSMEKTYPFNRHDGDSKLASRFSRIGRENIARRAAIAKKRAALYADLIGEVRIAGRWKKDHVRAKGAVLVASAAGVRRTAQFDHHNGRPAASS
jgi:hypothetical protein